MATVAETNGSDAKEIALLHQRSFAAYRAAGLYTDAQRVLDGMIARKETPPISEMAKLLAFKPAQTVRTTLSNDSETRSTLAKQLVLLGDFQNAATIFLDAAQSSPNEAVKVEFAQEAYSTLIAEGDLKAANKIKKDFQLEVSPYKVFDTKNVKNQSMPADSLKALGIVNATGNVALIAPKMTDQ
jgi:hypothetical protein